MNKRIEKISNGYVHFCPGCKDAHVIPDTWACDGNMDSPTFSPSVLLTGVKTLVDQDTGEWDWIVDRDGNYTKEPMRCHYVLTNGVLNYCSDSVHALSGLNIALPEMPDWLVKRCENGYY